MNRRQALKAGLVGLATAAGLTGCKKFEPPLDVPQEKVKIRGFYVHDQKVQRLTDDPESWREGLIRTFPDGSAGGSWTEWVKNEYDDAK